MPQIGFDRHGLTLPEANDACCFFIPIKLGVIVISCICLGVAVQSCFVWIQMFIKMIDNYSKYGFNFGIIIWFLIMLPVLYGGYLIIRFFWKKEKTNPFQACQMVILSMLLTFVWWLIATFLPNSNIISPASQIKNLWLPCVIEFFFYFYFMNVCGRECGRFVYAD